MVTSRLLPPSNPFLPAHCCPQPIRSSSLLLLSLFFSLCVLLRRRASCEVTAPHTRASGSPPVAQISEKMSTVAAAVSKWRLTEGVRRPRCLLVTLHHHQSGSSGGRRQERRGGGAGEHFEAIGGDVGSAQNQGCCWKMLPTNMAAVSLSSSLLSVSANNRAATSPLPPRLLPPPPPLAPPSPLPLPPCCHHRRHHPFTSCYCTAAQPSLGFFV